MRGKMILENGMPVRRAKRDIPNCTRCPVRARWTDENRLFFESYELHRMRIRDLPDDQNIIRAAWVLAREDYVIDRAQNGRNS